MKFIKDNFKYIFIFCFSLAVLVFLGYFINSVDSIWNYGFSYSISKGQIPYKDFTMIIPPFFNFIMAIGLVLFSHNNIVFLIEQSLLITITFYFLYKMYNGKAWLFLLFMCFPIFLSFSPTYNYFIFFLAVILLYLEKNNKNDYVIGLFLGFMLLTKHTVAVFFILSSILFYFKDKNKLFKRLIGLVIPCVIFLLYLLITDSISQFIDLCFFGLFDFGAKNTLIFTKYFFVTLIIFIIMIIFYLKNRNNICYLYLLVSISIMFPLFTAYHFYIYLLFFCLLLLEIDIKIPSRYIKIFSLGLCFVLIFIYSFSVFNNDGIERFSDVKNFNYYYALEGSYDNYKFLDNLYKEYSSKSRTILLSHNSSFINISNEYDNDYFTILNRGNYGYNGTKRMINKVKKMKNTYFIVDMIDYKYEKKDTNQFDYEIVDYIIRNSKLVYSSKYYMVYFYE